MKIIVSDVKVIEIDILIHIFRKRLLTSIITWSQVIQMFLDVFGLFDTSAVVLIIFNVLMKINSFNPSRMTFNCLIKSFLIECKPWFTVVEIVIDDVGMVYIFGI